MRASSSTWSSGRFGFPRDPMFAVRLPACLQLPSFAGLTLLTCRNCRRVVRAPPPCRSPATVFHDLPLNRPVNGPFGAGCCTFSAARAHQAAPCRHSSLAFVWLCIPKNLVKFFSVNSKCSTTGLPSFVSKAA